MLLFNNRIYGLTKGQYSPTSEVGKRTKTTPYGSVDRPIHPISVAIAAEATFVARTVDTFGPHLREVLDRAAHHKGSAFIEILQNCVIFNDGAFADVEDRKTRADESVSLVHGQPLVFGRDKDKGIRLNGLTPEVVPLGGGVSEKDLVHHDEFSEDASLAYLLSQIRPPEFPTPIGVFRQIEEETYDAGVHRQIRQAREAAKTTDLDALLSSGETWEVAENASVKQEAP